MNQIESKISIIIPVYNVAKFLKPCLDSLLSQTFEEFEAIVVDDGSTDSSGEICDEYKQKDSRIKVIHKDNGGVSSALNIGLDVAKSPIIYFVDGDDSIVPQTLFEIYNFFQRNEDVDILGFNNKFEDENGLRDNIPLSEGVYEGIRLDCLTMASISPKFIERKYHLRLPAIRTRWAKAFKRELIEKNSIRFKETLTLGQDALFCTTCLSYARKVVLKNLYLYQYRVYSQSNIQRYRRNWEHLKKRIEGINEIISLKKKRDFNEVSASYRFAAVKGLLLRNLLHSENTMNFNQKKDFLMNLIDHKLFQDFKISFKIIRYLPEYAPYLILIKLKCARLLLLLGRFL